MSPAAKFNALLASVTVSIMCFMVVLAAPYLRQISGPYLVVTAPAGGLITSAGIYTLLSLGLRWLMERWPLLNEKILGAYYMHGTWVGWFEGHSKEMRYMVEHFVQDLDGLVITGRSFTGQKVAHGYWESESTMVDARKGRLHFTYRFDVLTQKMPLSGIHTSLFERRSAQHPPTATSGFAHDLNDETRIAVNSTKISNELLPWNEALAEAVKRFPQAATGSAAAHAKSTEQTAGQWLKLGVECVALFLAVRRVLRPPRQRQL